MACRLFAAKPLIELQWKMDKNSSLFYEKKDFENVCEIADIDD